MQQLGIQTNVKKDEMKVDITLDNIIDECYSLVYTGVDFTSWVCKKIETEDNFLPLAFLLKKLLSVHKLNIPYIGMCLRKIFCRWNGILHFITDAFRIF